MNLAEMIDVVRKDLHNEDSGNYRWTDEELARHIGRAVRELSERVPLPAKVALATTSGSRELDISGLSGRIMVEAVEYPIGESPPEYQRFSIWGDTLTIISGNESDGSNCYVYYGALHTLDSEGSTIPAKYEDLVATGACGCAVLEQAAYTINKVNVGGTNVPREFKLWGSERLGTFQARLRRLRRRQRVRVQQIFESD